MPCVFIFFFYLFISLASIISGSFSVIRSALKYHDALWNIKKKSIEWISVCSHATIPKVIIKPQKLSFVQLIVCIHHYQKLFGPFSLFAVFFPFFCLFFFWINVVCHFFLFKIFSLSYQFFFCLSYLYF